MHDRDADEDGFGNALAVGTNAVFVGEAQNDASSGYVYVYGRGSGGRWAEQAKLHASDAANADRFGSDVATSGDLLLVGATAADTGLGAAYVFHGSATGVASAPARTLDNPADQIAGHFGGVAAIAGDVNGDGLADACVTAIEQDAGAADEGNAFVFHGSATGIPAVPTRTLDSPNNSPNSSFGWSVPGGYALQ